METILWSAIILSAKKQARLRKEGKFKEADEEEKTLKDIVKRSSKCLLNCTREGL